MSGAGNPVMQAAARLEAAVERLASAMTTALARPAVNGVPRAEVVVLTARLEATIGRLRAALQEDWQGEGPESDPADAETPDAERPDARTLAAGTAGAAPGAGARTALPAAAPGIASRKAGRAAAMPPEREE
jgi:hypothetical protein